MSAGLPLDTVARFAEAVAPLMRDIRPDEAHRWVFVLAPEGARRERRVELAALYRENGVHRLAQQLMNGLRVGHVGLLVDLDGATKLFELSFAGLLRAKRTQGAA